MGTVATSADAYGVNAQAMIDGLAEGEHQLRLVVEAGVVGIDAFSASGILPVVAPAPTEEITPAPTDEVGVPTEEVTVAPSDEVVIPTEEVTIAPTDEVIAPTEEATIAPTEAVTAVPTETPTVELPTALPFPTVDIGSPEPPTEAPTATATATLGARLALPTGMVFPTVDTGIVEPTATAADRNGRRVSAAGFDAARAGDFRRRRRPIGQRRRAGR